jgi:hypothetical protein
MAAEKPCPDVFSAFEPLLALDKFRCILSLLFWDYVLYGQRSTLRQIKLYHAVSRAREQYKFNKCITLYVRVLCSVILAWSILKCHTFRPRGMPGNHA